MAEWAEECGIWSLRMRILDIHPRNKRVAGERMALPGRLPNNMVRCGYSGPLFKTMKVSGNKAVLSFEYAEDGLMTPEDAPVKGFWLQADRRFYPAVAVIKGSRLEVSRSAGGGTGCRTLRFCITSSVNLYNKSGLPGAFPYGYM